MTEPLLNPNGTATRQDILDLFDAVAKMAGEIMASAQTNTAFNIEAVRAKLISKLNRPTAARL